MLSYTKAYLKLTLLFSILITPVYSLDLKTEQDAWGMGMGGAVAALSARTHSLDWNPAGVGRTTIPTAQLGLGFKPKPFGDGGNIIALYPTAQRTVFGFGFTTEADANFPSLQQYRGTIAFPLDSSRDLLLGINLKYLTAKRTGFTTVAGHGLGMDVGLVYDLRLKKDSKMFSFAWVAKDINTQLRFSNIAEEIVTRSFVFGVAFQNEPWFRAEVDYEIVDKPVNATQLKNQLRLGAERLFDKKKYSGRLGFDDVLGSRGTISVGGGYHPPDKPFEVYYALRVSEVRAQTSHFLTGVYRFDKWFHNLPPSSTGFLLPSTPIPSPIAKATVAPAIKVITKPTVIPTNTPEIKQVAKLTAVPTIAFTKEIVKPKPTAIEFGLKLTDTIFSPNGDKIKDVINITIQGAQGVSVSSWEMEISDASSNKVIHAMAGKGKVPNKILWNGKNTLGVNVGDGKYNCLLTAQDLLGNIIKADAVQVIVDLLPPSLDLSISKSWVSFEKGENVTLKPAVADRNELGSWKLTASNEKNFVVYTVSGIGEIGSSFVWDGKANGSQLKVSPGSFLKFKLTANDLAGNKTESLMLPLQVMAEAPGGQSSMSLNLATLFFEKNTSTLSASAQKDLVAAAKSIQLYIAKSTLIVKGYSTLDETGDVLTLSHIRAVEIRNFLAQQLKIAPSTIKVMGLSNQDPLTSPTGKAPPEKQRRGVVTLYTRQ